MYFMTINKITPEAGPEELGRVIPKHIQWIKGLIREGKIAQAGKWGDSGGMAILKAENMEEAGTLLSEDPPVKSGLITFELAPFYPDVAIQ